MSLPLQHRNDGYRLPPALYMSARDQNLQYHTCATSTLQRSNLPSIRIQHWGEELCVYEVGVCGGSKLMEGIILNHPPLIY